ncbi:hypothetical protein EV193_104177 [Herbihabitans rhizosphaerae]|uniref:SAV-6107-like HEPN domain-containing protein n=1 Tax=Herbihabitans rhizosphaerae TaxID=1872711 RepID=A0A4Q7KRD5_9PSEU|nr:SAV_6107 family HEPN domain-containing protein [Herbihabitans rhizosphaerae]RZS38966.1 hypothetical protein EV193_104177 [Herbihabitans rhizosphaerae]
MTSVIDFDLAARPRGHRAVRAPRPASSARGLLEQAERGLIEAAWQRQPAQRFADAYLAALRGAAALVALRGRPHRGRSRPTSVWKLLPAKAPELREWAEFFAACSSTRAAIQAGITRTITDRAADDLVRQTGQFLDLVRDALRASPRSAVPPP